MAFIWELLKILLLFLGGAALIAFLIYLRCIYFIAAWRSKYTKQAYSEAKDINEKLDRIIELLKQRGDIAVERCTVVESEGPSVFSSAISQDKINVERPSFPQSAEEYQRLYGSKKTE